jgi:carbonic anhydrase
MKTKQFFLAIMIGFAGCTQEAEIVPHVQHWEYELPDWKSLGYSDCGGKVQSPINIQTTNTIKATLGDISFNYAPFNYKIIDNGHTIQVNNNGTNTIKLNGAEFAFKQFHFHAHSEHKIDGKASPLEVHLVHQDDSNGNLTVLGIMLEEGTTDNTLISKVWKNIPTEKSKEISTTESINLNDILPTNKKYYTYTGSLTTPPCSQGLQWIVFKESVKMSKAQIAAFTAIYADNARPIQEVNNRPVLEKTN